MHSFNQYPAHPFVVDSFNFISMNNLQTKFPLKETFEDVVNKTGSSEEKKEMIKKERKEKGKEKQKNEKKPRKAKSETTIMKANTITDEKTPDQKYPKIRVNGKVLERLKTIQKERKVKSFNEVIKLLLKEHEALL
ncbi:hypothetical protein EIN_186110 [Entamoeba invadens IP1]|uniref:hypothetical protein n=1 Tax=Entamoeba invadens IP1 TaxID=370355 RepID=UPI0002C3F85A|nr:hypothetical protein EIN_186110 [Entamoeba invadens IP1]ELP94194.1 hypothetical protein EIN_186110 [Entamoeba invadens IP1]|eukprot:XP_004260965.1 hypothetical protein EIN_186110 [Entamoeba invadens IP1]